MLQYEVKCMSYLLFMFKDVGLYVYMRATCCRDEYTMKQRSLLNPRYVDVFLSYLILNNAVRFPIYLAKYPHNDHY